MSRRDNRQLQEGEIRHIYNRGNRYENTFIDDDDYYTFLIYLDYYRNKYKQKIITYCLMPNHFHLLAQIGKPIDFIKMMQMSSSMFSKYFNKKYSTVGHMFQDKYKDRLIEDNKDLVYVSRYIHRNPLEILATESSLDSYWWSSFSYYIDKENTLGLSVDKKVVLSEFYSVESYERFVKTDTKTSFKYAKCTQDITIKQFNIIERRIVKITK